MADSASQEFVSRFAHDLRQPLRAIMVEAQRLQRHGVAEDTGTRLAAIIAAARRQEELIAHALDFDQACAPVPGSPLAFSAAIQSACLKLDSARRQCQGEIQVDIAGCESVPVPAVLARVLEKLLENALRFGFHPGDPPRIGIAATAAVDSLHLRVADSGPGIDPQYRGLVFEPFRRLRPSPPNLPGGFGLGLATCRRWMESIGGSIRLADPLPDSPGLIVLLELPRLP